ncbi:MAG: amidohydrolase family protein, partial [Planctomycetota bacterium]|nr:amidohydrolase family protein [Planctomycetota bacterium]
PGLFDAHVHLTASVDTFAPMLVASGVTCVRDTGAPTDLILALRSRASGGGDVMPQIVCTGAIIDGDPPIWPFSEACDEPDEAREAVRKLAKAGVDQIKVYSLLDKEVYEAAVTEAHRLGLKVTGHIPAGVTVDEAIEAGQDCVEHLTGFEMTVGRLAGWSPDPGETSPWAWFEAWSEYPKIEQDKLRAFAKKIAAAGMHQCPTLVVAQGISRAVNPEEANADPRMVYVPAGVRSFWSGPQYQAMGRGFSRARKHMQSMVGELHRAGVPLLVGTDLANPYVFAGFAVHEEMALFQEAGIPAADVLRAATIVPARFCGVADQLGTVTEGKVASLVLVRANPLDDVRNAAQIEGVFLRGRYFDRTALDGLLADAQKTAAASAPVQTAAIELDLPGEEIARGRYVMTFQQFDAGVEDFVITKDDDGYHVMVHSQPLGSPQPPFVLSMHADKDFNVRTAEYRVLKGDTFAATYAVCGATVTAEVRRGDGPAESQSMALGPDAILSGPANATEFLALGAAGLAVGESRAIKSVGFGFQGWRLQAADYTLTRGVDTTITLGGHEVSARAYTSRLTTDWGDFNRETWTDPLGVVLKVVLRMPFGTLTVEREDAPQEKTSPE